MPTTELIMDTSRRARRNAPTWPRRMRTAAVAEPAGSVPTRVVAYALVLAGAALVAASALIHLHLWADGYRNIATIGPFFLAQAIVGLLLAVLLTAYPRPVVAGVAAGYLVASIGALLLSAWNGLFGFHDRFDAPWATTSLVIEVAGTLALLLGAVWLARRSLRMRLSLR